ncbi:MAG TPA: tetratricopeptide repeat protein, partial [Ktedonobacterales bacterium]|nr:tetratricopeptide repeat protein [Ktedonobacterales bacterium]
GQLEEAIVGADAVGDLAVLAEALRMASWTYQTRGAFPQSQAAQERALAVAGRLGDVVGLGHTLFLDALLAFYRGDWGRARAIAESSLEVFRALTTSYLSSYPPLGLGWLSVIEGQLAAGEHYLAEAETLARQSGPDQVLRFIAELRAECELLAGEPEAANARLLPLFTGEPLQERTRLELMVLRAWAALQLGELREAEEALKDCVGSARECEMYLVLPDALRVQALWAMRQRDWQEAENALDEALALCQALPYPYAEAKVLYVLGQLHTETGEPEQARVHLEQALAICRRLGERLYGAAIEQSLAALPPGANA